MTLREILSIIGLSQELIPSFRDENGNKFELKDILIEEIKEGKTHTLLKTPKLIKHAKLMLNCPMLLGISSCN